MIVGVPREIKPGEQRVALTPAGARALAEAGHRVEVEHGAGGGSGIRDDEYATVGAALVTADEVWQRAELVLKVKEPLPAESAGLSATAGAAERGPVTVDDAALFLARGFSQSPVPRRSRHYS